jgi:palmitoyltransferase
MIMTYLTLVFYLAYIPLYSSSVQAALLVLNSVLTLVLLACGVLGTYTDPSDPTIHQERTAKQTNCAFDISPYSKICTICCTHVFDDSKHCCDCNTCVIGFDHHCKWLNNCIGSLNYKFFIALIVSFQALTALHSAVSIFSCVEVSQDQGLNQTLLGFLDYEAYLALAVISGAFSFSLFVVNGHLIAFHIWITKHGLSTYDFILRRRETNRRKSAVSRSNVTSSVHPQEQLTFRLKDISRITGTRTASSRRRDEGWESDRLTTNNTHLTELPLPPHGLVSPADSS